MGDRVDEWKKGLNKKKLPVTQDDRQKRGFFALQNADDDDQSDDDGDRSQDDNKSHRSSDRQAQNDGR